MDVHVHVGRDGVEVMVEEVAMMTTAGPRVLCRNMLLWCLLRHLTFCAVLCCVRIGTLLRITVTPISELYRHHHPTPHSHHTPFHAISKVA